MDASSGSTWRAWLSGVPRGSDAAGLWTATSSLIAGAPPSRCNVGEEPSGSGHLILATLRRRRIAHEEPVKLPASSLSGGQLSCARGLTGEPAPRIAGE